MVSHAVDGEIAPAQVLLYVRLEQDLVRTTAIRIVALTAISGYSIAWCSTRTVTVHAPDPWQMHAGIRKEPGQAGHCSPRSKSSGVRPIARSRTQPPTSQASNPACSSFSRVDEHRWRQAQGPVEWYHHSISPPVRLPSCGLSVYH